MPAHIHRGMAERCELTRQDPMVAYLLLATWSTCLNRVSMLALRLRALCLTVVDAGQFHTCIGAFVLAADGAGHVGSNSIHTPASHAEHATGCGSAPVAVDILGEECGMSGAQAVTRQRDALLAHEHTRDAG